MKRYLPAAVFSIYKYLLFNVVKAVIVTHAKLVAPEHPASTELHIYKYIFIEFSRNIKVYSTTLNARAIFIIYKV